MMGLGQVREVYPVYKGYGKDAFPQMTLVGMNPCHILTSLKGKVPTPIQGGTGYFAAGSSLRSDTPRRQPPAQHVSSQVLTVKPCFRMKVTVLCCTALRASV